MRRYLGIAVGLGLLVIMLSATNAGPAMAQTFKPVMALITNDMRTLCRCASLLRLKRR